MIGYDRFFYNILIVAGYLVNTGGKTTLRNRMGPVCSERSHVPTPKRVFAVNNSFFQIFGHIDYAW